MYSKKEYMKVFNEMLEHYEEECNNYCGHFQKLEIPYPDKRDLYLKQVDIFEHLMYGATGMLRKLNLGKISIDDNDRMYQKIREKKEDIINNFLVK